MFAIENKKEIKKNRNARLYGEICLQFHDFLCIEIQRILMIYSPSQWFIFEGIVAAAMLADWSTIRVST